MKLKVYGVSPSAFVRKVLFTLKFKGLEYEHIPSIPHDTDPDFIKVSPIGKIPAINIDGFCLADSSVICAYLEKLFPSSLSLYPKDAKEYGQALWFEEYADTELFEGTRQLFFQHIVAPMRGLEMKQNKIEETLTQTLPKICVYLEKQLNKNSMFLVGQNFSMADLSIVSQFVNLYYAGYQIDNKQWPLLEGYLQHHFSNPLLKQLIIQDIALLNLQPALLHFHF